MVLDVKENDMTVFDQILTNDYGKDIVIVDLDGTLCEMTHRVHLAQAGKWDEYHENCCIDTVHIDIALFLLNLPAGYIVIAVTGRNEKYRGLTEKWLRKHELDEYINVLLMRPDGDWRKDAELKLEMIDKYWECKREDWVKRVWIALEDRDQVVEAYRNAGITTWQVRQGTF